MSKDEVGFAYPESELRDANGGESLLLQIRSDRRLGHEWDDWDGRPLPDDGVFHARETLFYQLSAGAIGVAMAIALALIWLGGPRLSGMREGLDLDLAMLVVGLGLLAVVWLGAVALVIRTNRNWLPGFLAEGGLVPWMMPKLERLAVAMGISRDRTGNALVRVFNRLAMARRTAGIDPREMLILLPRCLAKESMRQAMDISTRYDVPVFVAARGRYARQMIAMRRPKGIVAVACERDLVSGLHDVAGRLPVLGTTLQLGDGPCRNTEFTLAELEGQVRTMLGLAEGGGEQREVSLCGAGGAVADHFEPVAGDLEPIRRMDIGQAPGEVGTFDIAHGAAAKAAGVEVLVGARIVASRVVPVRELDRQVAAHERLERLVHGSKRDVGDLGPNRGEYLVSGGVVSRTAEEAKHRGALLGETLAVHLQHASERFVDGFDGGIEERTHSRDPGEREPGTRGIDGA